MLEYDRMARYIVIGSGPNGVACASALLSTGDSVTMIDVGKDLAQERQGRVAALGAVAPTHWTSADRQWLTEPLTETQATLPVKRLFGDAFMYENSGLVMDPGKTPNDFALRPSHALGGLSRVWGATLARLGASDLVDWPFSAAELAPHYDEVERLIPMMTGARLATSIIADAPEPKFPLSPQAAVILDRWQKHQARLAELGASVTPARIAVARGCRLCGMCLHGCAYGQIFTSADWVRTEHRGFTYRAGLRALRIEEDKDIVRVSCATSDAGYVTFSADRLFLAAGVLGSTRLVLASRPDWRTPVTLHDSQYFLLPFLTPIRHRSGIPVLTLSQIFLSLSDESVSARRVHTQYYAYNDIYAAQIASRFGSLRDVGLVRRFADLLGRHFVLAQGYLHSQESASAQLILTGDPGSRALAAQIIASPETRPSLRRVWRRLARIGHMAGMIALPALGQVAAFGSGYHCGATFPMSGQPRAGGSDLLGRIAGWKRIHLVDASCWPDIPSGPVTLTGMANSDRIARQAAAL